MKKIVFLTVIFVCVLANGSLAKIVRFVDNNLGNAVRKELGPHVFHVGRTNIAGLCVLVSQFLTSRSRENRAIQDIFTGSPFLLASFAPSSRIEY